MQERESRQRKRHYSNKIMYSKWKEIGKSIVPIKLTRSSCSCMRRLQANLSYMAAQADRKTETKGPPYPGFMTAPPLNLSLRPRAQPMAPDGSDTKVDPATDREERDKAIKDLYRRLQAAYPGVDFKKESAARAQHSQKSGNAAGFQGSPIPQKTPQIPNVPPPQVS